MKVSKNRANIAEQKSKNNNKQGSLTGCSTVLELKRFQDFLNFFDSRPFNYSMTKEGSSGVIGDRNSI